MQIASRTALDGQVLLRDAVEIFQTAVRDALSLDPPALQDLVDRLRGSDPTLGQAVQRKRPAGRREVRQLLDLKVFRDAFQSHGTVRY